MVLMLMYGLFSCVVGVVFELIVYVCSCLDCLFIFVYNYVFKLCLGFRV